MSEGQIPIGLSDLPIDTVPRDESLIYHGTLNRATVSPKLDKNGYAYASVQVEITEGDFEGRSVSMNYLPLPVALSPDMTKSQRIRALDKSVSFARFARAFSIHGNMPAVDHSDPDTISMWQEWVEKFYGNGGKFTVRNQEFPEGSGRMRSGIADFIF